MSIFQGIDEIIDDRLRVGHVGAAPHHHHRTSLLEVCTRARPISGGPLFPALVARFEANFAMAPRFMAKGPSEQNWRFEKKLFMTAGNPSVEKQIEKAAAALPDWVNQVPTASGLWDSSSDKLRNIDLVRRASAGVYEFIELKYQSDNPLRAAMEILGSAALYIASRHCYPKGLSARSELLTAKQVHLRVVAPGAYYQRVQLGPLERALSSEIGDYLAGRPALGLGMDFCFQRLPEGFRWPDAGALQAALDGRVGVVDATGGR